MVPENQLFLKLPKYIYIYGPPTRNIIVIVKIYILCMFWGADRRPEEKCGIFLHYASFLHIPGVIRDTNMVKPVEFMKNFVVQKIYIWPPSTGRFQRNFKIYNKLCLVPYIYEGRYLRKVLRGGCMVIRKRLLNPWNFWFFEKYCSTKSTRSRRWGNIFVWILFCSHGTCLYFDFHLSRTSTDQ